MIINADARHLPIANNTVQCIITSPPYFGLRDYGMSGQIGLEQTPDEYVSQLVAVFRECWRVLKDDGTLWLNIGDSYAGSGGAGGDYSEGGLKEGQPKYRSNFDFGRQGKTSNVSKLERGCGTYSCKEIKPKDLIGIPWMVAFALRADGWYLRSDIIWHKPNPMPESVKDRPTKAHEYLFLLTKSARYYYDAEAIQEAANYDGRNDEFMHGSEKYNSKIVPGDQVQNMALDGHIRWKKDENGLRVRNRRSVWTISTQPCKEAHYAIMPEKLVEPCILAGSKPGDIIFDPFAGSGTVERVAIRLGRKAIGTELNYKYISEIASKRTSNIQVILPMEEA